MTREQIMKGLEACAQDPEMADDCMRLGCPYKGKNEPSCIAVMCRDALKALKEGQE